MTRNMIYEYQSDRSHRGASSSDEDSETGSGQDDLNAGGSEVQDRPLQLCPRHPAGEMVEACTDCSKALGILRPEVAKQMLAPLIVSSVVSRYAGRSDEKTPTMLFSDATLDLAFNTFTQGRGKRISGTWWIRILLCLPNSMRGLCRIFNWSHYSRSWRMKSGSNIFLTSAEEWVTAKRTCVYLRGPFFKLSPC